MREKRSLSFGANFQFALGTVIEAQERLEVVLDTLACHRIGVHMHFLHRPGSLLVAAVFTCNPQVSKHLINKTEP